MAITLQLKENETKTINAAAIGLDLNGVSLSALNIAGLPATGKLKFRNAAGQWVDAIIGQQITATDLDANNLMFSPDANAGNTNYVNLQFSATASSSAYEYNLGASVDNLMLLPGAVIGRGNTLDNTLTGSAGDNFLDGMAGNDTMRGGLGNDGYWVDSANDVVVENANEGMDTVNSSAYEYNLAANVENLVLLPGAVIGRGNTLDNTLIGSPGDNFLDGMAGNDTMKGGLGNDGYWVDSANDVVVENANEGMDTVNSSAYEYNLAANVENLVLLPGAVIGRGNTLDNTLIGSPGDNFLDGMAGNDTMKGGLGNDGYWVDSANDVVIEYANEGIDTVNSYLGDYSLQNLANVENLYLFGAEALSGTGNALNNTITGNARNNTLRGSSGNDTLDGGSGMDTADYSTNPSGGVDADLLSGIVSKFKAVSTPYIPPDPLLYITTPYSPYTVYGLDVLISIENLTGSAFNDSLTGDDASNTLKGQDGDDSLAGGRGDDVMLGGAGSDIYKFGRGDGADTVFDEGGANDRLQFLGNIDPTQLWLRKVSSNLEVSIIGTADKVTITSWDYGIAGHALSTYQLEEIGSGDGKVLWSNKVDSLVQAMASFQGSLGPGQTMDSIRASMTGAQQATLAAAMTNWQ